MHKKLNINKYFSLLLSLQNAIFYKIKEEG